MTKPFPMAYGQGEDHPWVRAYLEHCLGAEAAVLNTGISASDEMFAYAIDANLHHRGHALVSYFRSGLLAFEATRAILEGSELGQHATVLDFASGHGRMTRFLNRYLDAGNLSICEVGEDAPAFQQAEFGVRCVEASLLPEDFDPGRLFDLVIAFSFFSHLPRRRFAAWLERLWSAVEPGGVLAFTTHGPSALPPGRALGEEGFLFEPHSESERLGVEDYGSSWVASEVVMNLAEDLPQIEDIESVSRGVWSFQDLWLLSKAGGASRSPDKQGIGFDLEPIGFLETSRPFGPERAELTGWAMDRSEPGRPVQLRVFINGKPFAELHPSGRRPDLVDAARAYLPAHEGLSGYEGSTGSIDDRLGFALQVDLGRAITGDDFLIVEAESSSGRKTVLHASALEGAALLRTAAEAEQRARNEAQQLRSRLYAMEQSRFWRLRNRWFAVKQLWQKG